MSNSIHTARWINQIENQGWDLHLFPAYSAVPSSDLRNITLYGLTSMRSRDLHPSVRYRALPFGYAGNILEMAVYRFFPRLWTFALNVLVRILKPDIIHSLEFQHSAYLSLPIIQKERKRNKKPPLWIVTNWGSDIYLFGRLVEHRERVRQVLEQCDFYSCECERDVKLAQDLGLVGQILPVFPNAGGFDQKITEALRQPGPSSQRRLIMLKGYQGWAGRALVGLRALERCADLLRVYGYQVAIYNVSPEVEIAAELFEQETNIPITVIPKSTHTEILKWFGQARLYIGLSISDGISTSLLEAMIMGAFPIQSCTSCADEWIEDGKTGIIVPPEDTDIVEQAIRQALLDNELVNLATEENRLVARERLDQMEIRQRVLDFYEQVIIKKSRG